MDTNAHEVIKSRLRITTTIKNYMQLCMLLILNDPDINHHTDNLPQRQSIKKATTQRSLNTTTTITHKSLPATKTITQDFYPPLKHSHNANNISYIIKNKNIISPPKQSHGKKFIFIFSRLKFISTSQLLPLAYRFIYFLKPKYKAMYSFQLAN